MNIKHNSLILFLLLLFSMIITLILHSQTYTLLTSGVFPQVLTPDPWYIIRQTELAAHSFPSYTWFDPFTGFPDGTIIYWGPFLPLLCGLLAQIPGSGNESAMILFVSWIPVLTAMLTIPLAYWFGKEIKGEMCGIAAAFLMAVMPGSYLIRSMYGYVDHHIFESFFMLAYSLALVLFFNRIYGNNDTPRIKPAVLGGGITGLMLGLGMINAPTMILIAGITTIFVLFAAYQLINQGKNLLPFSILIGVSSCIGAVITQIFYTPDPAVQAPFIFNPVSLASVLFIPAIAGFLFLGLQFLMKKYQVKHNRILPVTLLSVLTVIILAFLLLPGYANDLLNSIMGALNSVPTNYGIAEYFPLSLDVAFFNYHLMLLMLIPGLLLLLISGIRKQDSIAIYLILWTGVTGLLTITNTRYEILFAVPLALTTAYFLDWLFHYERKIVDITTESLTEEKSVQDKNWRERPTSLIAMVLLIGTCLLSLCIGGMVATADYNYQPYVASEDWVEGLLWMKTATPDPGVNYYQTYQSDTFTYPDSSYGVLSWWDYGHWITTIAHRMAVTNPFQANLDMGAQFFMDKKESGADTIATTNNIRYIITDADMLFDTMQMMMKVKSKDLTQSQYMGLISTTDPVTGKPVSSIGYRQAFYESMVTRLHVFDGSAVTGEEAKYEEEGTPVPGTDMIVIFPGGPDPEISESIIRPIKDLDALQHYRLIWESNTSLSTTDEHDIRKVKIYERVPGAIISGEGTIELQLTTNRDRVFTYRQKSHNGTFTLPYSTSGSSYPVQSTGPYRIIETGEEIVVPEEMVMSGLEK
ncbi:oligosaccharyl transferase, archaeosortase A system-associated [Methanospirillum stamsii]|uniref:dolichyl-phosphooligosaccharide-protein glycotransferase n=1 Tax=Methanospirillum stamsii TaxID=1277351 RepID=A0A2V2NBH2_9EURY|nr:oligosaccharyl transferase, archaeosortase A system-associated [Methanospirillum stamsii]PWR72921.1 hypothetical protein DLD82_11680 [Methanospirillum stamsii]